MATGTQPPPRSKLMLETTFTVYPAMIGTITEHVVMMGHQPHYDDIRAVVAPFLNDDHFEQVTVVWNDIVTDMFVGETSAASQPRNVIASQIYRANAIGRAFVEDRISLDPDSLPPICGTAVLFHRRIWF